MLKSALVLVLAALVLASCRALTEPPEAPPPRMLEVSPDKVAFVYNGTNPTMRKYMELKACEACKAYDKQASYMTFETTGFGLKHIYACVDGEPPMFCLPPD